MKKVLKTVFVVLIVTALLLYGIKLFKNDKASPERTEKGSFGYYFKEPSAFDDNKAEFKESKELSFFTAK